jgi:hypothetical protein
MSAAPGNNPTQPAPAPRPTPPSPPAVEAPRRSPAGRVLLFVSGALLLGWMCWLGYTALTKSRAPIVSRAQAAVATVPVLAKLTTGNKDTRATLERRGHNGPPTTTTLHRLDDRPAFIVTVVEQLTPNGPKKGDQIGVGNLPGCAGFTGDGDYLLLLARDGDNTIDGHPSYYVVREQRSPGWDPGDTGQATIYRWDETTGPDLHQQVKRLFP